MAGEGDAGTLAVHGNRMGFTALAVQLEFGHGWRYKAEDVQGYIDPFKRCKCKGYADYSIYSFFSQRARRAGARISF